MFGANFKTLASCAYQMTWGVHPKVLLFQQPKSHGLRNRLWNHITSAFAHHALCKAQRSPPARAFLPEQTPKTNFPKFKPRWKAVILSICVLLYWHDCFNFHEFWQIQVKQSGPWQQPRVPLQICMRATSWSQDKSHGWHWPRWTNVILVEPMFSTSRITETFALFQKKDVSLLILSPPPKKNFPDKLYWSIKLFLERDTKIAQVSHPAFSVLLWEGR